MGEKTNNFRLAWDVDGVWAKSSEPVLKEVNRVLNTGFTKQHLTNWHAVSELVKEVTSDETLAQKMESYWFDPAILYRSLPNPVFLDVFNRCRRLSDIEQYAITTRQPSCYLSTRAWLEMYFPLDDPDDWQKYLRVRSGKSQMTGDQYKASEINILRVNLMVEDNTGTIIHLGQNAPHCRLAYVTQPWNESDTDSGRTLLRVSPDDPDQLFNLILQTRDKYFSSN